MLRLLFTGSTISPLKCDDESRRISNEDIGNAERFEGSTASTYNASVSIINRVKVADPAEDQLLWYNSLQSVQISFHLT